MSSADLRREFKHQLLQKASVTVMEDSHLWECGEMNADSNLRSQVQWKLLQDFILPYNLFVDVKMLIPVVNTLSEFLANVMAAQICLHLKEKGYSNDGEIF